MNIYVLEMVFFRVVVFLFCPLLIIRFSGTTTDIEKRSESFHDRYYSKLKVVLFILRRKIKRIVCCPNHPKKLK